MKMFTTNVGAIILFSLILSAIGDDQASQAHRSLKMAANQTSQCNICCRGPPGRDGRDGPPGSNSPISHQDYLNIRKELEQELKSQIIAELKSNLTTNRENQTPDCKSIKNELKQELKSEIIAELKHNLTINREPQTQDCNSTGKTRDNPAASCEAIALCDEETPSGSYWIKTEQDHNIIPQSVYCNMGEMKCGIGGGWMRVAHIDMTNQSATCPPTLRTISSPKRMCARTAVNGGCSSVMFSTGGVPYTRVCGRAVGYAYYSPDAFHPQAAGINGAYVDGLSITHGQPRKHIWTYAAGVNENHPERKYICPCAVDDGISPPSFVGENYHCESGNTGSWDPQWYIDDPLWDGKGCVSPTNNCCSTSGLPWFSRALLAETTDNIEVRWCADSAVLRNEDVATELLEIFVQ